MIKIAICDDIPLHAVKLKKYLQAYSKEYLLPLYIKTFDKGEELIKYCCSRDFQIFFLDLMIPEMDGYEIAEMLQSNEHPPLIIFNTTYYNPENAMKGYHYKPYQFLDKQGINYPIIKELMNNLTHKLSLEKKQHIIVKNDHGIHRIPLSDILYLKACNSNTEIRTVSNGIICYHTLAYFEEELQGAAFFRCHHSYLVNLEYVNSFQEHDAYITSKIKIPVSKRRKKEFLFNLAHYISETS